MWVTRDVEGRMEAVNLAYCTQLYVRPLPYRNSSQEGDKPQQAYELVAVIETHSKADLLPLTRGSYEMMGAAFTEIMSYLAEGTRHVDAERDVVEHLREMSQVREFGIREFGRSE